MRYITLSILILSLLGMKSFAQDDIVKELLLGNNPESAFKPGVGQVLGETIKPLVNQTPIISPYTGQVRSGPPGSLTAPPPAIQDLKIKSNKNEYKLKSLYDYSEKEPAKKEDGKYGSWEVPKKESTDPKVLRKEAIQRMILSNEIAGSQGNYSAHAQNAPASVSPPAPSKKKIITIPYNNEVVVQTIPYNK